MKKTLILFTLIVSSLAARAQIIEMPAAQPKFTVATMPKVQEQLKLTDEQKKKIGEILGSIIEDDGQGRRMIKISGDMDIQAIDKDVIAVLDGKQAKRFTEIYLQVAGYSALSLKEFSKKLEITQDQQKKLDEAWEHNRARIQDSIDPNAGPGAVVLTKADSDSLRAKLNKEVEEILTKSQIETWKSWLGEKFEMDDGR